MINNNLNHKQTKKKYIPSSFLVIFGLMFLFIIASWIGRAVDSTKINGIGVLDLFTAVWHGFKSKVEIIIFIFSIGGTLAIMTKIKAIDAGIDALIKKMGDKTFLLIPILMVIFGLGGTTYGMWEETIAFIPVLIPVFKKAGYGAFTAILVILIGAGTGCLASTVNPFAPGVAVSAANSTAAVQEVHVADLIAKNPTLINDTIAANEGVTTNAEAIAFIKENNQLITTGTLQGTRWVSFILFEIVAITIVTWLATRYKKGLASNFQTDQEVVASYPKGGNALLFFFKRPRIVEGLNDKLINSRFKEVKSTKFTTKRKISLTLFVLSFVLMVLMYLPWYDILGDSRINSVTEYDDKMWWFASTSSAGYAKIGDWYFISVAAIFLLFTIIIFGINIHEFRSTDENVEQGFINSYMSGIKDMVTVSMLIAVAAGLGQVLEATGFGKLIAEEAAKGLNDWVAFGVVIFLVSIFLSLLVPSTSGFAGAFIPIFAGIAVKAFPDNRATAIGIAILGFIFANGLANFVTPTSAALMGYTQYAGVPYNIWIKQTWKITAIMFLVALFLVVIFSAAASGGSSLF